MSEEEDLRSHLDEMVDILGTAVTKEELEKELKRYIQYGIPLEQAKELIVKRHGGSLGRKSLSDVEPNESNIELLCKVISINPREIEVGGEKRKIFYGFLGDETATRSFTAWKDFELERGDAIRIKNAYSREWNGKIKINLSERTEVEKVAPEMVPFTASGNPTMVKLGEIKEGMGNVEVIARILSLRERKVTARGEEKLVYSGILGDKTGKAMYTAWKDFGLKENEVVKISNAYIKSWRGMPQLIFDERSTVEKLEDERLPSVQEIGGKEMQISNLVDKGGALDVVIEGTVLEIREGSGLIYRCPECNRAIKKGICRIHGEVDGKPDLRIKAVVDDGTGVVDALLNKGLTEKILGKKLDRCIQMAKEAMNHEIIKDELADKLIAKPLRLRGNAFSSDYGIRFMASEADVSLPNIEEGADNLLRELGG